MKFLAALLAATAVLPSSLVLAAPQDAEAAEIESYNAQREADGYSRSSLARMESIYKRYVRDTLARRGDGAQCNSKNVIVRKEW